MPRENPEVMPLLPTSGHPGREQVYHLTNLDRIKVENKEYWENKGEKENDDEDDDKILFRKNKKSTSLILNDSVLLIIHYLQLFALMMSMGLRWPWPRDWIIPGRFIFLVNLDVWDFMKVHVNGSYVSIQNYYTRTHLLPFPYWYVLAGWAALIFLLLVAYLISYIIISTKKHPFMFIQLARLLRGYIIIFQLLALPFGIVLARLFHCNSDGETDFDNTILCNKGIHWAYMTPAFAVSIVLYILYPVWLVRKTKAEMLNMSKDRHEGYLQLKETEYEQGLDVLWMVASFHIFSSFKKRGAHLRAVFHVMLYAVIIVYAAFFFSIFAQALIISGILTVMFIAFIILRPFRVSVFNYYLIFCYLCLVANCMMGALVSSFDAFSLRSVWLTPNYLMIILAIINGCWALFTLVFIIYLLVRTCANTCCCKSCWKEPLWPSMTPRGLEKLSPHTKKYVKSIFRARFIVEKCRAMPPIFAPAHELARHIHIINAYLREAEYLKDPMHGSLWDLLDDLIEAHELVAPKSLFAESVKSSIRYTAKDLMRLMPAFVRRLAQREYDFILVHPVKKRLLLKMYIMGLFLNGRKVKANRQLITRTNVEKIWNNRRQIDETEVDDGYYEEMYPVPEEKPTYRPTTAVSIVITDEQELDDDAAIEQAEQWAADHPLSAEGRVNPAYQDDDLAILMDTDSVNISQMLDGIPSPPPSANPSSRLGRPMSPGSGSITSLSRPSSSMRLASPRPGSSQGSEMPRVKSETSIRPRSGNSNRPTSPQATDSSSGPATPLPGQIDDSSPDFPKQGESHV